jgi:hypothetical protein
MPRIEIVEGPAGHGRGVVLKLDGREVPAVRSIYLSVKHDDAVTAEIEVLVTEKLHFDGGVGLCVSAIVMPGYVLEETIAADGSRSYRAREDRVPA